MTGWIDASSNPFVSCSVPSPLHSIHFNYYKFPIILKMHPKFYRVFENMAARENTKVSTLNFYVNEEQRRLMGVIHFVMIVTESKNARKVVVKQAWNTRLVRKQFSVHQAYANECHFYKNVWPSFQEFQNNTIGRTVFDMVPTCFELDGIIGQEKLVFENLKDKNFENCKRFTRKHYERIMEQYGKFHALSFAIKKSNPKLFSELAEEFYNYFEHTADMSKETALVNDVMHKCRGSLVDAGEMNIIENNSKYFDKPVDTYANSSIYSGEYAVILHGDCRRDNMMFRYDDEGNIEDVKLLDFQYARAGTPVFDLSSFLYSYAGYNEDVFKNLEDFLKIYYHSLSETLKLFNYDANELYPYQTLLEEWRIYCRFGYFSGLLTFHGTWTDVNEQDVAIIGRLMINELIPKESDQKMVALTRHMETNNFL